MVAVLTLFCEIKVMIDAANRPMKTARFAWCWDLIRESIRLRFKTQCFKTKTQTFKTKTNTKTLSHKTKTKTHDLKTKTKTFEIRSQDVSRPRLKSRELHVWKAYRRRYGQDCEQTHSDPVVVQVVSKLLTLTSYCSSPIMRNSVVKDLREDRLSAVDSSVIHWRQNQNM